MNISSSGIRAGAPFRRAGIVIAVSAAACLLLGCSDSPQDDPIAQTSSGRLNLLSVEPVLYERGNPPYYRELLAAPGFEKLMNAAPDGGGVPLFPWKISTREPVDHSIDSTSVGESSLRAVLTVENGKTRGTRVEQSSVSLPGMARGAWVTARMRMRAPSESESGIVLTIPASNNPVVIGQPYSGSGEWEDVTVAVPLPRLAAGSVLSLAAVCRQEPPAALQLLDASIAVFPSRADALYEDETVAYGEVLNGGFDEYGFSEELPYPWKPRHWGSKDGSVAVVSHPEAKSGDMLLSLTPPTEGGGAAIWQRLPDFQTRAAGKRVVAEVMAFCDRPYELSFGVVASKEGTRLDDQSAVVQHPGDARWHRLQLELQPPLETTADAIEVSLFHKPSSGRPGGRSLADDVAVYVSD